MLKFLMKWSNASEIVNFSEIWLLTIFPSGYVSMHSPRLMAVAVRDMANLVTDDDADWIARVWRAGGAGSRLLDRRKQVIRLTEKANAMRSEAIIAATQADDALFAGFRRFERELLLEYIRRILDNAAKT